MEAGFWKPKMQTNGKPSLQCWPGLFSRIPVIFVTFSFCVQPSSFALLSGPILLFRFTIIDSGSGISPRHTKDSIWKRKDYSVTKQADLRAGKQIMPAQDVCSQNHCGMAGDEWVVFIASGSFLRERLSWRMILAILVGKSDRTQIPPPISLLAWEMMARQGLDLWVVRYKDEKNHHPHSLLFFETKSCPSRTGFLFLFFLSEILLIQGEAL